MIAGKEINEKVKDINWPIEEPTKIKHQLLRSYIFKWIAILFQQRKAAGRQGKLNCIDCFPGLAFIGETAR
jgi:hypothetical protein